MTRWFVASLCTGLIITGCVNSVATKSQDNQCVRDCDGPSPVLFNQPVLQTLQMFIGEMALLVAFWFARGSASATSANNSKQLLTGNKTTILSLPAICDILATTLMNIALTMIPVSVYQMARGALIIVVAIFSVVFLDHRISRLEWSALALVVLGVTVVGCSGQESSVDSESFASFSLVGGILLILLAQVFMATQFVFEEHIMHRWDVIPLQLVGFEGFFGALVTLLLFLIGHGISGHKNPNSYFNLNQAFTDMFSNDSVLYSSVVIMMSIACFNYFGTSITKHLNATSRSTVDTCRTLMVWCVSLSLGWEKFNAVQLCGFILLVMGTLIFNGAIEIPDGYMPKFLLDDRKQGYTRIVDSVDEEIERF